MDGPIYLDDVRYTQNSIGSHFKGGKSLKETISELKETPELAASFPPITLMPHAGHHWVVDGNRRLYAYRKAAEAGVEVTPYVDVKEFDPSQFYTKFSTNNMGEDVVLRGDVVPDVEDAFHEDENYVYEVPNEVGDKHDDADVSHDSNASYDGEDDSYNEAASDGDGHEEHGSDENDDVTDGNYDDNEEQVEDEDFEGDNVDDEDFDHDDYFSEEDYSDD